MKVERLLGNAAKAVVGTMKDHNRAFAIAQLRGAYKPGFNLGSDPEIFLEDGEGHLLPAFEVLPNKKHGLEILSNCGNYGTTCGYNKGEKAYWDGFQAEFSTFASCCLSWQVDSIHFGLETVLRHVREKFPKAKFSTQTVVPIPEDMMARANDEQAGLGCMPSKNAYGATGVTPTAGRAWPIRCVGGHMHFGDPRLHAHAEKHIKFLDKTLGILLVSMNENWDNPLRRRAYGLAGEYRTPYHGLEYRTPSNAWMFHPLITHVTFDVARAALGYSQLGYPDAFDIHAGEVQRIINECDVPAARKYLDANRDLFIALMIMARCRGEEATGKPEMMFGIFRNGMESVIADPTDIEGNWLLLRGEDEGRGWIVHSESENRNLARAFKALQRKEKV